MCTEFEEIYGRVFEKFAAEDFSYKNERNSFQWPQLMFTGPEEDKFLAFIIVLHISEQP